MENKTLKSGIDVFLSQADKFRTHRFAIATNNAATTSEGESSRAGLLKAGFPIVKLFSPEHGLTAQGEDGAFQKNTIDTITNLPVISLYGENLMPAENDLVDVDAVLFDIPDVGCRFYTYLWTMTYVMEACAKFNKQLIILDRPNPLSGNIDLAEGPMLDEENCSSFIGRWSIPVRHSCTFGELANYFSKKRLPALDLQVIKIQNWDRNKISKGVDWPFVPTSPAIVDIETALLYPGMGLLEGINVNEGRGTTTPFRIFGAPWINAEALNETFQKLKLAGISSRITSYKPVTGLYANEICNGLKLSVTDPVSFRPVNTGLQLIHLLFSLYPNDCKERLYKTRANHSGKNHLDKLTGVFKSLEKIKKGELLNTQLPGWKETIAPYLLY